MSFQDIMTRSEFSKLGQTMINYVKASLISLISTIVIVLIALIWVFQLMFSTDLESTIFNMIDILIIFGTIASILLVIIGILVLVRLFQYLKSLKEVGDITGDLNLIKSYKMYLWSIILSIVLPIVLVIIIVLMFGTIMGSIMSGYPMSLILQVLTVSNRYDSLINGIYGFSLIIQIVSSIIPIITAVLQILSILSFANWAQSLPISYGMNQNIKIIQEGAEQMKIGIILSIFLGTIGTIVYLVGMNKVGKALVQEFSNEYDNSSFGPQYQSYVNYGTGANYPPSQGYSGTPGYSPAPNYSSGPNYSSQPTYRQNDSTYRGNPPTYKAPSSSFGNYDECPYCGGDLPDPNAKYCPTCGRYLHS